MEYRKFGNLEQEVSALGFGMMRLPTENGAFAGAILEKETIEMVRYAIDRGLTYVDTAYPYHGGASEVVTGKALKDGYRDKVKLATKSPVWMIQKEEDFERYLDEQLKRLGDDHIDFYLLHALGTERWEDIVLRFDLIPKMENMKKKGKIGKIGFSFHDGFEAFTKIVDGYDGWEFCQIQLNYLDVAVQAGVAGLKYAADRGLGVIVMEPLLGGKLARLPQKFLGLLEKHPVKKSPVEWALDWLWDQPEVSLVLSGMNSMAQAVENMEYAGRSAAGMMTPEDKNLIAALQGAFESAKSIPCTQCAYCLPCPSGVHIPQCFDACNISTMFEDPALAKSDYARLAMLGGPAALASSCIGCRACESKCPQHIRISELLPKIHEALAV
ncbi:MAG: aldo/keto reductase [Clostridiales Family XIII bacterium]|jgi:predicted aldo/keto reductase-like oxidoreductase|nr:aldo/keto reductase [Clostridiales Family XIII bacterium]